MTDQSLFKVFYASFYSKYFYKGVGEHWGVKAFFALFVVIALSWAPLMIQLQFEGLNKMLPGVEKMSRSIPEISIRNGEVSSNVPMPFSLKDSKTGKPFFVMDTTGKIKSLDDTEAKILLTKTEVFVKKDDYQTRSFKLRAVDDFTINQELVKLWGDRFAKGFVFLLFPIVLFGSYCFRLFQAMIYSLIGLMYVGVVKSDVGFTTIYKLSLVSIIPNLIIFAILESFKVSFWGSSLLSIVLAVGYLFFAIKSQESGVKYPIAKKNDLE